MFARRVGNLLQAFSCVPRVAPIMEMDLGFAEVPVWVNGSVQFVDVKTLVQFFLKSFLPIPPWGLRLGLYQPIGCFFYYCKVQLVVFSYLDTRVVV